MDGNWENEWRWGKTLELTFSFATFATGYEISLEKRFNNYKNIDLKKIMKLEYNA